MNHILITGGAGFIGQHLLKKLSQLNCEITVIDNLAQELTAAFAKNPNKS